MNVLGIQFKVPSNKALVALTLENLVFFAFLSFLMSKQILSVVDVASYLSGFFISSLLLVSGLSLKEDTFKSIAIIIGSSLIFWYLLNLIANN